MRRFLLGLLAAPCAVAGQGGSALRVAATAITPKDIQRRIAIIADDSMMGRDTPSPGLELTARYVAEEFRKAGLRPAGDRGSYLERYTIAQRRIVPGASWLTWESRGLRTQTRLDRDARLAMGGVPRLERRAAAVLLGGAYRPDDVAQVPARGRAVVLVMDYRKPITPDLQQVLQRLMDQGPAGIVLLSNRDSATFQQRVARQAVLRLTIGNESDSGIPVVEVRGRALEKVLGAAGVNPDLIREAPAPVIRDLPDLVIGFDLQDLVMDSASAPNTVGLLPGSDPVLSREYLVYSAHMDHLGTTGGGACPARGADTICNGADDDASGTVSVIELARAFARLPRAPKRSILFLTVSGEEKGLWGSQYFTAHPPVPMSSIVADLNIDMVGRNWKDSIVAIGKEQSDLGETLDAVARRHPELHMRPIDDLWPGENFYFRSDHFNFARRGVPILFFFNGTHPDYHQATDSPDKIDAEKQSRIVRLLFYLGNEIANRPARPRWNPGSYARIAGFGPVE
ncbi:MAG TPA: M28 family peptidase [Gemmatimonadales bacterium]|nr:M28 family peptidase [Gemmatimonadales bacterium]